MKVVVCFGEVKIVVPCGNGELLVRDLIEKSVLRYKKATGKPPDYWVNVRSLENLSDGGILDPDDQVYGVADDREKLLAIFEEQGRPLPPHNGGDGTSASSAGTASPEMFHGDIHVGSVLARDRERGQKVGFQPYHAHDIDVDVTTNLQVTDNKLHVRHGSEPALRSADPESHEEDSRYEEEDRGKRWSTLAAFENVQDPARLSPAIKRVEKTNGIDRDEEQYSAFSRFGRDSARQSILGNHPAMYKWAEAQDNVALQPEQNRGDPVGGDLPEKSPADGSSQDSDVESFFVDIENDGEPVGLHVVPYTDPKDGRELGMLVRGVEEGSKAYRDGRIQMEDKIVEINNLILAGVSFERAQEVFREAMTRYPYVRLRIERDKLPSRQISEEDSPLNSSKEDSTEDRKENVREENIPDLTRETKPSTPVRRRPPPTVPLRSPGTVLTTTPMKDRTNVRKIGKKLHIQLTKGPQGLGFSITTRDNPAGGKNPIYIKNILPKGAAIADGRLKPGDRLLEVNGIEMTGKPQADAVSILRSTKLGSVVHLVVSRQEHVSARLPRQMPNQEPEEVAPNKTKDILTFDIALNDTGSAGLGVSVKGKTTGSGKGEIRDLGIFIKAVIHGGAASKDGRLRQNDQLLYINDVSLLKLSNGEAMETLRRAMSSEKSPRSTIKLVVARRTDSTPSSPSSFTNLSLSSLDKTKSQESLSGSSDHPVDIGLKFSRSEDNLNRDTPSSAASASEASETSDNTVLYNPPVHVDSGDKNPDEILRHRLVKRLSPGGAALARNNSYNLAVFTASGLSQGKFTANASGDTPDGVQAENSFATPHSNQGFVAPTLPMGNTETVIIEDTDTEQDHPAAEKSLTPQAASSPQWSKDWEDDLTMSPGEPGQLFFTRDGFGRQSISEKHKGTSTIDAKQTDWYAKHRKQTSDVTDGSEDGTTTTTTTTHQAPDVASPGPLVRVNSADSLINRSSVAEENTETDTPQSHPATPTDNSELGPALGMVKSSSLESLQTMVAQVANEDESPYPRPKAKVVRGRGCNESFRAAVDRSYDDRDQDDDDDEEEEEPLEAVEEISDELESRSRSPTGSTRSSVDSLSNTTDPVTGKPLKAPKNKKKSGGLFKGIGSMFKFGQKRRPFEPRQSDLQKVDLEKQKQDEIERYKARQAAKDEHQRIQEQHRKLREQQALQKQLEEQQQKREALSQENMNKAERMLQLRQQHQQRHLQRHSQYARDDMDKDDDYDQDNQKDNSSNPSNYSSTDASISQYLTQREQRLQEPSSSSVAKATDSEYNKSRYQEGRDSPSPYGASPSKTRAYNYMDHTKPELRYSDYYAQQPKAKASYSYGSLGRPSKLQAQTQPHARTQATDKGHSTVHGRTTPSLPAQKPTQSEPQPHGHSHGVYSTHGSPGRTTPSLRTDYQGRTTPYSEADPGSRDAGHYAESRHYSVQGNYGDSRNYDSSGYYGESGHYGEAGNYSRNSGYTTVPRGYRHSANLDEEPYYNSRNQGYGESRNDSDSRRYKDTGNYADSRNHRESSNYEEVRDFGDTRYFYRGTRDPEKV